MAGFQRRVILRSAGCTGFADIYDNNVLAATTPQSSPAGTSSLSTSLSRRWKRRAIIIRPALRDWSSVGETTCFPLTVLMRPPIARQIA